MDEEYNNQKYNNTLHKYLNDIYINFKNFIMNINYSNKVVQYILCIMMFFFVIKLMGMFRFNINI